MGFRGIIPYLVSPIDGDGRVDDDALRALVRFLLDAGVDGLSPLGSTGEAPYLDSRQRERIVKVTIEAADGKVPVIPGVAAFSSADARARVRQMEAWGADGVVGIQQSFGRSSPGATVDYFTALASATDLPVVLYSNPHLGNDFSIATIEQICQAPNVLYLKEASGVTGKLASIRCALGDRLQFFAASAHIPTAVFDLGGVGWMAGPACVIPHAARRLWELHESGERAARDELMSAIWPLNELFGRYGLAPLIKAALGLIGLPVGDPVPPTAPAPPEAIAHVRRALAAIDEAMASSN